MSKKERLKAFLLVVGVVWGIGIPFALYMDSITQAPWCEGPDRYSGQVISSRAHPTPQYTMNFSITHKTYSLTSYQELTPLFIYFSPDGTEFFIDHRTLEGYDEWYVVETKEYGIVKVCVIKN